MTQNKQLTLTSYMGVGCLVYVIGNPEPQVINEDYKPTPSFITIKYFYIGFGWIQNSLMRKLLFISFLFLFTFCFSQKFDIKIQQARYRQNKGSYFTEWSSWEKTSVTFSVNADLLNISINSKPQETFSIIDFKPTQNIDNAMVQDYYCIDSKNKRCTITLVLSNEGALVNLRYKTWEYIYSGYIL